MYAMSEHSLWCKSIHLSVCPCISVLKERKSTKPVSLKIPCLTLSSQYHYMDRTGYRLCPSDSHILEGIYICDLYLEKIYCILHLLYLLVYIQRTSSMHYFRSVWDLSKESLALFIKWIELLSLSLCRFSVNVFQPPFQSGRTSPETSQCRVDLPAMPAGSPEGVGSGDEAMGGSSAVGAGDLGSQSLLPETQGEYAQASALHSAESDSLSSSQTSLSTTRTTDSGFSEPVSTTSCSSLDPHAEKETSCEKAVRPEGDNTTYGCFSIFVIVICCIFHHLISNSYHFMQLQ